MLALVENWKGFEFRVMYMVNLHVTASINIEGIENKWGTPSKHNNVKKKENKKRRPTNISPQSFNPTVTININVNNRTKINKGKTNKQTKNSNLSSTYEQLDMLCSPFLSISWRHSRSYKIITF